MHWQTVLGAAKDHQEENGTNTEGKMIVDLSMKSE
mgnify:FL=1